jgi:NADH-quinone oxidoreductase subunit M
VYGSFGAVLQVNVKNLLAYSSIGYYGIMASLFAAFTLLSQPILKAALLVTLVFHTVIKVLAFLNTSLVYQVSNTYDVYRLGYLYYVTRKGALSAFTALLSLTGIPPSIGFTVKLLLLLASINLSLIHTLGIPLLVAIVLSSVFSIAYGAKFMGIYLSSIPRITPRPIPIPQLELNAEIYLGAASLILPLSILLYTYYTGFLDSVFAIVLIAIYAITFTAYTLLFTRIYTKPDIPEDVKYWLSGVES